MAKDKEYLNNKQFQRRRGYNPLNLSPGSASVNIVGMVHNVSYLPSSLLYEWTFILSIG